MKPWFIQSEQGWLREPDMVEDCTDDCGECQECLAIAAEEEVEALADDARKERGYNK